MYLCRLIERSQPTKSATLHSEQIHLGTYIYKFEQDIHSLFTLGYLWLSAQLSLAQIAPSRMANSTEIRFTIVIPCSTGKRERIRLGMVHSLTCA